MHWITLFLVTVGVGFLIITQTFHIALLGVLGAIFGVLAVDLYRALKVNKRVRRWK